MAWIRFIAKEHAHPELRATYDAIRECYPVEYVEPVPALIRPDGTKDSATAIQSLIPEAMQHMMSGFAAMLQPHLPLSRTQHEMIATVVSAQNACFY